MNICNFIPGLTAKRFAERESGGVTIEFVMWLPVFVGIISLTIQGSMIFLTQSNYWSVARDTARLVARHSMSETAAEAYAVLQASSYTTTPTADVSIAASTVTVTLSTTGSAVTPFVGFGFLSDVTIDATVTQALEPI